MTERENEMLKLKPNCECCDVDLIAESIDARICSFECTFCSECKEQNFDGNCPNCGGELEKRPIRPAEYLQKYPPSTTRFVNQNHADQPNFNSRGSSS